MKRRRRSGGRSRRTLMTIVLIDDDATTIAIQKRYAKKFAGVEPMTFGDADKAAVYLKTNKVDLIVVDYSMPKLSGMELIRMLRELCAACTIELPEPRNIRMPASRAITTHAPVPMPSTPPPMRL